MSVASMRSLRLSEAAPFFDKCLIVQFLAYAYCLIIGPMLMFVFPGKDITTPRVENQFFWPLVTAIALGCLAFRKRSRLT